MRVHQQNEFLFQIISLLISVIVVHTVFVTLIHPNAEAMMQSALDRVTEGQAFEVPRNLYIVLKDFEQEACFILMFWAMAIMAYKALKARESSSLLNFSLIDLSEGSRILPEDAKQYTRPLETLSGSQQSTLLPRALRSALNRFSVTRDVQAATQAVNDICENESEQLDAELSMVRYITWAIPSVGFIGTVRGIGTALSQAHEAVAGDIAGVTASLGVAFNSTMVALLISIVVMFLLQQLQIQQERLVIHSRRYCEDRLLNHLKTGLEH